MLTLDCQLTLPAHVSFSIVGEDAFLLNTRTNKYYLLEEVGTRLWILLSQGKKLRESHAIVVDEYEVEPLELEQDLLELVTDLLENGLVELSQE